MLVECKKLFACNLSFYFVYDMFTLGVWLLKCCKNNFYVISKYISIQSNIFSLNQNIFAFKIKYFHLYNFFLIQLKYFFYHRNFSFDTFYTPLTISGLPFLFAKVRILLSVYKLFSRHGVVRKLLRRIRNNRILCNET